MRLHLVSSWSVDIAAMTNVWHFMIFVLSLVQQSVQLASHGSNACTCCFDSLSSKATSWLL